MSASPWQLPGRWEQSHLVVPHPFHIKVTNAETGQVEEQSGTFSDEDWRHLTEYLANSYRLAGCRFAESQSELNWKIAGEQGKPTRIEATLPPEDDIAAFLHYLRPFVLEKSPTNFARIRSIIAREVSLAPVQRYLKTLKTLYAGGQIPFKIEIGSRTGRLVLNSEEAIDKWLNGLEYHQDGDKQADMKAVFEVFTEPAARAMLLYCMLERASAIGKLGAMIDGFAKREGRQVDTR
jgi:hypothetical protein